MSNHHLFLDVLRNIVLRQRTLSLRKVKEPTVQCHWNRPYSTTEMEAKKTVTIERIISYEDVNAFSFLTGDFNYVHTIVDNNKPLAHGALLNGIVSGVIGTKLPGHGTLVISQTLNFPNPCYAGDTVIVTVQIKEIRKIISCSYNVTRKLDGAVVLEGSAKLLYRKK